MAHLELGCKVIKKAALRLNFAASLGHAKAKEKCRRQVPKKGVLIWDPNGGGRHFLFSLKDTFVLYRCFFFVNKLELVMSSRVGKG